MFTEKQEKLLELLFDPKYVGNPKQAVIDAGYESTHNWHRAIEQIKEEVIKKADTMLAIIAPEAIAGITDVLRSPEKKGAKTKLEAAFGILDREGLSKKERVDVTVQAPHGIFLIPDKLKS